MLEIELQKLGFNEKETKVYLAALELGYASAQDIGKKSGVNRATAYFIIDALTKRGLMTHVERDKKTFFAAEDPRGLSAVVEGKAKEAEDMRGIFKGILPQLESIYNLAAERPKVRYYEGMDGLQAMRSEFLEVAEGEIWGFISLDQVFKRFPEQQEGYGKKRLQKGIKSRVIYTHTSGPVEGATDKENLREARYVPEDKFLFTSDISIYSDRIAMASLKGKLSGVIIESKELADMMRAIFELAWEGAEKYQR